MPPLRVCIECGKIVRMARQIVEKLAQKLDQLPNSPGCYQMHNAAGKVIYVGKAVVLRNRVRSYFHASANTTPRRWRWSTRSPTSPGG
jgi:hypothetical protein